MPRTVELVVIAIVLTAPLAGAVSGEEDKEKVALRGGNGRFLSVGKDGLLRAEALLPGEGETFELIPAGKDRVALRASDGRLLTAAGRDLQTLGALGGRGTPRGGEVFAVVSAGGNSVGLRLAAGLWMGPLVEGQRAAELQPPQGAKPPADARLEIYQVSEVPTLLQTALATAVDALVKKELEGKEYDKTRSELKVHYAKVPAPTLRDPLRTKKRKLWATRHEYRVQARLYELPQIRVTGMPYLKSCYGPDARLMMFAAEAELPVNGRVGYRIPERVSASTGYHTTVSLRVVGQVGVQKEDDRLVLAPPEVVHLRVELRKLDIGNDLLNVAADPIEDVINREVRHQRGRILEQANKAVRKAFDGGELRNPLLRYLGLP